MKTESFPYGLGDNMRDITARSVKLDRDLDKMLLQALERDLLVRIGWGKQGDEKPKNGEIGVITHLPEKSRVLLLGDLGECAGAMNDGGNAQTSNEKGGAGHGYVLITATGSTTASTTVVSNAFTASSEPSTSRIVVFQETASGSPTLNTDLIASISRDGGSTFTNATLTDSGYVTGSSGQRILTGTATVSGQPSGTSLRWKLALANNNCKIHGVSLSWA